MSIETKIMRKLAVAVIGALALSAWVPGALLEGRQLGVAGQFGAVHRLHRKAAKIEPGKDERVETRLRHDDF